MPELDLSRRTFLRRSSVVVGAAVATYTGHPAWAEQDSMPPPIPKTPGGMDVVDTASAAPGFKAAETVPASPQDALQRLLNGNQRFVANRLLEPNHSPERRAEISKSQQPFATIFGCVDSRVPPEIIFDQGLGDLFVIRTAGQVIDEAVLGSIEFGSLELKIPLILVGTAFWGGMIEWFKDRLMAEGMIDPEDMNLIQLIDEPAKVVEAIFKHYESRPFGPLPNEHEMMLNL